MTKVAYSVVGTDEQQFVTVFVEGNDPLTADDSHPRFEEIVEQARAGNPDVIDLFDVARTVDKRFKRLTERVSVNGGTVFFDGDPVDDSITRQIVRFLDEGVEDWKPLVNFLEKVAINPNDHSRTQLFDWLRCHEFTITPAGNIVSYKGVHTDEDGSFVSGHSGSAIVNGEAVEGRIPNAVGAVVEMPRSEVQHDPSSACSYGLHVGTYSYAEGFANGAMLKVLVNPRDVVSVPTDASGQKVRVCRYQVIEVIDRPDTRSYAPEWAAFDEFYDNEDDLYCKGDPLCEYPECGCEV